MSVKQNKQNKDAWFNSVVMNAIYFLNSSVSNLDASPRAAIIELYTAIELIFKARLMKEHWSLVITKPESANLTKFENGDFKSVYLSESEQRLKNICNESFKTEAMNNFKALGEHRNQIVHFAHTDFNGSNQKLIIEHWSSWFYLRDLLINQWSPIFKDFTAQFDVLHENILKRKEFLQAKFDEIKIDIDLRKSNGDVFKTCTSCGLNSAVITHSHFWGDDFYCLVCEVKDNFPKEINTEIPCEKCSSPLAYFLNASHKCKVCQHICTDEYALSKYTEIYRADFEEGDDSVDDVYPVAYCHSCESDTPSVVEVDNLSVCVFCEERGWAIMHCDRCGHYVTGDPKMIEYIGCYVCEDEARQEILAEVAAFQPQ